MKSVPEWGEFDVADPRTKTVVTGCTRKLMRLKCGFKLLKGTLPVYTQ